jgi:hypothetical protein
MHSVGSSHWQENGFRNFLSINMLVVVLIGTRDYGRLGLILEINLFWFRAKEQQDLMIFSDDFISEELKTKTRKELMGYLFLIWIILSIIGRGRAQTKQSFYKGSKIASPADKYFGYVVIIPIMKIKLFLFIGFCDDRIKSKMY